MGSFHINWRTRRALTILAVPSEGDEVTHAPFNSPPSSLTMALRARSSCVLLTDSHALTGPKGHSKWDGKFMPKYMASDGPGSLAQRSGAIWFGATSSF